MPSNYIITNSQPKSGKTTTALNLALCLLTMGKKVQLISFEGNHGLEEVLRSYKNDNPLLRYRSTKDGSDLNFEPDDYSLIDCPSFMISSINKEVKNNLKAIVPVTMEFYGIQELKASINLLDSENIKLEGILPVMLRTGKTSLEVLNLLKSTLKFNILDSYIPRNFYLAKQFDHVFFELEKFTEKAGITYLNLANELIERESIDNDQ